MVPAFGNLCSSASQASTNSVCLFIRDKCVNACFGFSVIISLLLTYTILRNDYIVETIHIYVLKLKNVNRIVYAWHLNINSLRGKFEQLKCMISCAVDILVITETKLGDSFPDAQYFLLRDFQSHID